MFEAEAEAEAEILTSRLLWPRGLNNREYIGGEASPPIYSLLISLLCRRCGCVSSYDVKRATSHVKTARHE